LLGVGSGLFDDIGQIPGFTVFRMSIPGMKIFHFFETGDSIPPSFIAYFLLFLFDFKRKRRRKIG